MATGKVNATEAPGGVNAWARFLEALGRLIVRLIWAAVLVVILVTVGKCMLQRSQREEAPVPVKTSKPVVTPIAWHEVDGAVAEVLEKARLKTHAYVGERLDRWVQSLVARLDDDFLPWYFGYLTQQRLGLTAVYQSMVHWFDGDALTADERVTADVQEEFSARVLRPEIAQLEMERLAQDAVRVYVEELRQGLDAIPQQQDIPHAEWERYLEDTAALTSSVEGSRSVDLTLKAVVAGSAAGGTVVLGKSVQAATAHLGAKVSGGVAGKAAAGMAAETGAKVAAKSAGKMLGPAVGAGIIVWDVWDHYSTREENWPVLRQNLIDYLTEMKTALLDDTEAGVMTVVYRLEGTVLDSLRADRSRRASPP
jgi:hypothetical protein